VSEGEYGDALTHMAGLRPHRRVKIKATWVDAGRTGILLGPPVRHDQWWAVVVWDGEEDPDIFKVAGLDLELDA
jgi:hypothetical protein